MCVLSIGGIGDKTYDIFNVYEDISNAKCNCLDPKGGQTMSNDIKQYQTISNNIKFEVFGVMVSRVSPLGWCACSVVCASVAHDACADDGVRPLRVGSDGTARSRRARLRVRRCAPLALRTPLTRLVPHSEKWMLLVEMVHRNPSKVRNSIS